MATLISSATGNFTAAGTWKVVDSTSLNDTMATATALSTTYALSTGFIPGAITIDAIAVRLASRATGTPSNTISVALNTGASTTVAGTEVTIDVADMDACSTGLFLSGQEGGWYVFAFAAPVLLLAATTYHVKAKLSSTSTAVSLYSTATTNWARALRTTTTAAPATNDILIIAGEHTGSGTGNSFTVTMDETATTSYGATTPATSSLSVNKRSTLSYGTTASTNYYLKYKGKFAVYSGGTFNIGTSGTPMPSTSTAVLEMASASNVDSGLYCHNGSIVNFYGNPITNVQAKLAADASAGATSLTTDISTGWLNGDTLALASTTRTASQCESKALTADASGTTLTIAALGAAHSGTSPTQCEIINLTRNVKIRGISTSLQGYIGFGISQTLNASYAEFSNLGSGTQGTRGFELFTVTGSAALTGCSFYNFVVANSTLQITVTVGNAAPNNVTFTDTVSYNIHTGHLFTNPAVGSNVTVDTWTAISAANVTFWLMSVAGTYTDLIGVGVTNTGNPGIFLNVSGSMKQVTGTLSNITSHSNAFRGIEIFGLYGGTITNLTSWRNNTGDGIYAHALGALTFDTMSLFGNGAAGLLIDSTDYVDFVSVTSNAGATLTQPIGISVSGLCANTKFKNCSLGATTTHATADVSVVTTSLPTNDVVFENCQFSSTTELANQTTLSDKAMIASQKHDQTTGNHKTWKAFGTINIDTTIYDSTPSLRMTPNNASSKLTSEGYYGGSLFVAVNSGSTVTVSVKVRESVVGDGTDYNGNRIRLRVKANTPAGIAADATLATASASSEGAFETISGTTAAVTDDCILEFVVDCDGTTGWVNVDTWGATAPNNTRGLKYWLGGNAFSMGDNISGATTLYDCTLYDVVIN